MAGVLTQDPLVRVFADEMRPQRLQQGRGSPAVWGLGVSLGFLGRKTDTKTPFLPTFTARDCGRGEPAGWTQRLLCVLLSAGNGHVGLSSCSLSTTGPQDQDGGGRPGGVVWPSRRSSVRGPGGGHTGAGAAGSRAVGTQEAQPAGGGEETVRGGGRSLGRVF